MTIRTAMFIVVQCVRRVTGVDGGNNSDRGAVVTFAGDDPGSNDPATAEAAPILLVGRVGDIPLRNFFSHSSQAFDAANDGLWQDIQVMAGLDGLDEPGWTIDTDLLRVALTVHDAAADAGL